MSFAHAALANGQNVVYHLEVIPMIRELNQFLFTYIFLFLTSQAIARILMHFSDYSFCLNVILFAIVCHNAMQEQILKNVVLTNVTYNTLYE